MQRERHRDKLKRERDIGIYWRERDTRDIMQRETRDILERERERERARDSFTAERDSFTAERESERVSVMERERERHRDGGVEENERERGLC